jgi:membrane-bound lytic murein transglycosylase B
LPILKPRLLALTLALSIAATGLAFRGHADAAPRFDLKRPEIVAFVDARVQEGADRKQVLSLLARAEPQPKILDIMSRPAEKALQWWEYRARFMTEERIDAGVKLWREQHELLESVAHNTHVAPQYILAILGVETFYGRNTGRYRVLDVLSTLSFDYPPRSTFFQGELAQFMRLASEKQLDPLVTQGSYAGAMGVAQFMPSSFRQYAVTADGAAAHDLWNDWGSIFASVGNYLGKHGWQFGGPVLADATYAGSNSPAIADRVALNETVSSLKAQGFTIDSGAADDTLACLVGAPLADRMSYRIGFNNFYVITRYNRSPLYAMVVSDLADAIAARYNQVAAP